MCCVVVWCVDFECCVDCCVLWLVVVVGVVVHCFYEFAGCGELFVCVLYVFCVVGWDGSGYGDVMCLLWCHGVLWLGCRSPWCGPCCWVSCCMCLMVWFMCLSMCLSLVCLANCLSSVCRCILFCCFWALCQVGLFGCSVIVSWPAVIVYVWVVGLYVCVMGCVGVGMCVVYSCLRSLLSFCCGVIGLCCWGGC